MSVSAAELEYDVVWNGSHAGCDADLLRPIVAAPTPEPIEPLPPKERSLNPPQDRHRHRYAVEGPRRKRKPWSEWRPRRPVAHCKDCGKQLAQTWALRCYRCRGIAARTEALTPEQGHAKARKLYKVKSPCEVCGTSENIHRHHVDRNPMNNARENIQFLCATHHIELHAHDPRYRRFFIMGRHAK